MAACKKKMSRTRERKEGRNFRERKSKVNKSNTVSIRVDKEPPVELMNQCRPTFYRNNIHTKKHFIIIKNITVNFKNYL